MFAVFTLCILICYDPVDHRCDNSTYAIAESVENIYSLSNDEQNVEITVYNNYDSMFLLELNKLKSPLLTIRGKDNCYLNINFTKEWQKQHQSIHFQEINIYNYEESECIYLSCISVTFFHCNFRDHQKTSYIVESTNIKTTVDTLAQIEFSDLVTLNISLTNNIPKGGLIIKRLKTKNLIINVESMDVITWYDKNKYNFQFADQNDTFSIYHGEGIEKIFIRFKESICTISFGYTLTNPHSSFIFINSAVICDFQEVKESIFPGRKSKFIFRNCDVSIQGERYDTDFDFRDDVNISFCGNSFKCSSIQFFMANWKCFSYLQNFILETDKCVVENYSVITSYKSIFTIKSLSFEAINCTKQILHNTILQASKTAVIKYCSANFTNCHFYDTDLQIIFNHSSLKLTNYFDKGALPEQKAIRFIDNEIIVDNTIEPIVNKTMYIISTPDETIKTWTNFLEYNYEFQITNSILFSAKYEKDGVFYFGYYFTEIPSKVSPEICYGNSAKKCEKYRYYVNDSNVTQALDISKTIKDRAILYLLDDMKNPIKLDSRNKISLIVHGNNHSFLGISETGISKISIHFIDTVIDIRSKSTNLSIILLNITGNSSITEKSLNVQLPNATVYCDGGILRFIVTMKPKIILCNLKNENVVYVNKKNTFLLHSTSLSIVPTRSIFYNQKQSILNFYGYKDEGIGADFNILTHVSNSEKIVAFHGSLKNSKGTVNFIGLQCYTLVMYNDYLPVQADFSNLSIISLVNHSKLYIRKQNYYRKGKRNLTLSNGNYVFEGINIYNSTTINIITIKASMEVANLYIHKQPEPQKKMTNVKIYNCMISNSLVIELRAALILYESNIENCDITLNIEPGDHFSFISINSGETLLGIPRSIYINISNPTKRPRKQPIARFLTKSSAEKALSNASVSQPFVEYNGEIFWVSLLSNSSVIYIDFQTDVTEKDQKGMPLIPLLWGSLSATALAILIYILCLIIYMRRNKIKKNDKIVMMTFSM